MPVIAIGSVGVAAPFHANPGEDIQPTLALAPLVDLLGRGEFDLVALGRAVLADPEWARKLADGRLADIRPYDRSVASVLF
jgi:2,4-dienoyl-CoA reductase-like NADH-dependent reductase (Old Yellow Enzyme family)